MSGCKIGKVRLKSGGAPIYLLPKIEIGGKHVVDLGWGTVTLETPTGGALTNADIAYMLRAADAVYFKSMLDE